MKCPRCGKETPNESQSCVNCGVKFRRVPKTPPVSREPAAGEGATVAVPSVDAGATRISPAESASSGSETPKTPTDIPPAAGKDMSEEEQSLREALAGRYEIIRKLGSGGMASVYLAREIALNREVAIKLLPRAFVRNADFVARFKNEAQVAANLEHPGIVRIYQIAEEGDLVYFVMSLIPGGSLTDKIAKTGPLPVDQLVKTAGEVCSALAYGHSKGVIHRDLKPDNIMLDRNGSAIVMDYGIAKAGEGTGLTQTGSVIGTPQYMSPEQARGHKLDARSDLYSFGIVLYQMATGELPFQASDAASLMYQHVHENPAPPDAVNANVPEWLRNIIMKCLAKNPDDRFVSAEELRAALAEKFSPKVTATPLRDQERRSGTLRLAAIAAIILVAVGAGAFFIWRSGQQKEAAEQARIVQEQQAADQARTQQDQALAEKDDRAWQQALGVNSAESFNTYLLVYPEGRHVGEARDRLTDLAEKTAAQAVAAQPAGESPEERVRRETALAEERRKADEAERIRQDNLAYQNAEMVNTEQSYSTYLKNYPQGIHQAEAQQKLGAISTTAAEAARKASEETAAKDNQAFQLASSENTRQAYSAYLISFPNGRNSTAARERIASFEQREAQAEKVRIALGALSIRMALVPRGTFLMGAENGGADEKPVRKLAMEPFEMSATEITQGQFRTIMGVNPSFFKLDDNNPVERVTWQDAAAFCNKLSEKIGLESCYNLSTGACDLSKNGFRLATEAEWEYACRAESGSDYTLGDGESALDRAGWYQRNSGEQTHPVGQRTANTWGLYDMHGNVWEWCGDWYAANAYASGAAGNPAGPPSGKERVVRGGSYLDGAKDARSAKRRGFDPADDYSDIGFRIVRR